MAMSRKWNDVCVGDSNQPTIVGAWTKAYVRHKGKLLDIVY